MADCPQPSLRLPAPASLFDATPQPDFAHRNLAAHEPFVGPRPPARLPLAFFGNQLYRFEPLVPLLIIPIAYTDSPVSILSLELLSTILAWMQG
jgi:hypothetical protein